MDVQQLSESPQVSFCDGVGRLDANVLDLTQAAYYRLVVVFGCFILLAKDGDRIASRPGVEQQQIAFQGTQDFHAPRWV